MLCKSYSVGLLALVLELTISVAMPPSARADDETADNQTSLVHNGAFVLIRNHVNYGGNNPRYLNADSPAGEQATADTGINWYSTWKLIKVTADDVTDDDVYLLHNEPENLYIGKTSTTAESSAVNLVSSSDDAGRYRIYHPDSSDETWWGIRDIDNDKDYSFLQIEPGGFKLINYMMMNGSAYRPNSKCNLTDATQYTSQWFDQLYNSKVGHHVGDLPQDYVDEALAELEGNGDFDRSTWQAYKALEEILENPDYIIEPTNGHYYRIHSAFPYFTNYYLAETYYAIDFHAGNNQNRQRVHFNALADRSNVIPTFWEFVQLTEKDDENEVQFKLRAANSQLVMRRINGNEVVNTRDIDDEQAGIFVIRNNEDLLVYDHAVNIYCPSTGWYMSTFTTGHDDDSVAEVTDIRGGNNRREATDDYVLEANNWLISEVTEFTLYFEFYDTGWYDPDVDFIKAVCFPFQVKIPDDMTAYTASVTIDSEKNQVTDIDFNELTSGKIIPANYPVLLKAKGGEHTVKILYEDDSEYYSDLEVDATDLRGALAPRALDENEVVYVFDSDGWPTATRKIEGTDYSYSTTDADYTNSDSKALGYADYSIVYKKTSSGNPISYIIPANTAYINVNIVDADDSTVPSPFIVDLDDYRPVADLDDIFTDAYLNGSNGNLNGSNAQPATDANGNLIYYDLTGRPTIHPAPGFYLLSTGEKRLIR